MYTLLVPKCINLQRKIIEKTSKLKKNHQKKIIKNDRKPSETSSKDDRKKSSRRTAEDDESARASEARASELGSERADAEEDAKLERKPSAAIIIIDIIY